MRRATSGRLLATKKRVVIPPSRTGKIATVRGRANIGAVRRGKR